MDIKKKPTNYMISAAIATVVTWALLAMDVLSLFLSLGSTWISQQSGFQGEQQQNEPLERLHSHGPKPLHAQGAAKQDPWGEGEAAGRGGGWRCADDDPLPGFALDSKLLGCCVIWGSSVLLCLELE